MNKKNSIINFYEKIQNNNNDDMKHDIFDLPFRMLIIGPSGSMKTNCALNVIKSLNGFFVDVSIITKNSQEPLYQYLKTRLKDQCFLYDGIENTPAVDSFDKQDRHLIIFDDMVNEKYQNAIIEYFIRARKQNCSTIYISQSFYQTPIMIRKNIGYLIIKKMSSTQDLKRIVNETSMSITTDFLLQLYKDAVKNQANWLLCDLQKSRYYNGFELIHDCN